MNSKPNWIYMDYINNIWSFSLNDNRELCYKILYDEGKWTKESLIDKDVLDYSIFIEIDDRIHIIYTNIKGEIKYCTMKDRQWMGIKIHQKSIDEFEIRNLKVKVIGSEMHIFYLLVDKGSNGHRLLSHCVWDGENIKEDIVRDLILVSDLEENYQVSVDDINNIDLVFVSDERNEISLNHCSFQNFEWSPITRLYGIEGDGITFEIVKKQQDIHILNKSIENDTYYIDHVYIKSDGKTKDFKVYESTVELRDLILFTQGDKLYSCWLEEDKIFFSCFDDEKWSKPILFNSKHESSLVRYQCFIASEKDAIEMTKIYGTSKELSLYIPGQFVNRENDSLKYKVNKKNDLIDKQEEESLQQLKSQLSKFKEKNNELKNANELLNIQLIKKQSTVRDYEDRIARVLDEKHISDKHYTLSLELQENIKNELDQIKKQLIEEKNLRASAENKLKEYEEKNNLTRNKDDNIIEEKKK
ncbi:hypothetical protein [Alkalibaculum sporogenes]|uniref:hypothetical protein n=1 Tax=Alkalibaculum sporogenes TaxID=2655001 RepID=UPI001FEC46AC|nr:hypothetical protein [Alkalibaculum sporogenes]